MSRPPRRQPPALPRYDEVRPIQPGLTSVWLARLPDASELLLVCAAEMPIEEVAEVVRLRHPKFTLRRIDAGEFTIYETLSSWSADGRGLTHDGRVTLNPAITKGPPI